jgi:hypothetical protein
LEKLTFFGKLKKKFLENFMKTDLINKEELIEHYKKSKSALKTGKIFDLSGPTVLKIIRSFNVSTHRESKNYTDEYIISKYYELGTAEKTSIELGVSDQRVIEVLDRNNIERKKLKHIEVGNVYHKLTVLEFVGYRGPGGGKKNKVFLCQCECGGTREVVSNKLTSTKKAIKDCGCGYKKIHEEWELGRQEKIRNKQLRLDGIEENKRKRELEKLNKKPLIHSKYIPGLKKDRLTILSVAGTGYDKKLTVQCECGTIKTINGIHLFKLIQSCGCLRKEKSYRNGLFIGNDKEKELMYARYKNMKRRCYNEKNHNYPYYGGRGISICDRWMEPNGMGFVNFCEDMGQRPSSEYSIDRINNDGNYEPSNCKWSTNSEQVRNQRRYKTN